MTTQALQKSNGELLEKVILGNDLSGLNSVEKVQYVRSICDSLGLNPMTRPIQLIKFQGKEIPYFSKDATEQLRKMNNISLCITDNKTIEDIYIVTAEAKTPDGRYDTATGAVFIGNLKGEAKSNAFMKAETKAKRRATLSICGLGFIDESEAESIPHAVKLNPINEPLKVLETDNEINIDHHLDKLRSCDSMPSLHAAFIAITRELKEVKNKEILKKIIEVKDQKKQALEEILEIENKDWKDEFTGEVHE